MTTHTKGNVIVENIKIGDIHYEYEYHCGIKCEVISLPVCNVDGLWEWQSKNVNTEKIIKYAVHGQYAHYGPNLYDYEAYECTSWF